MNRTFGTRLSERIAPYHYYSSSFEELVNSRQPTWTINDLGLIVINIFDQALPAQLSRSQTKLRIREEPIYLPTLDCA